ncbi:MAG: 3'-5' exonuclease [Clostridiales bacterium]|nr:3'-5' exonuclease [Clostridiales bacterium]
MMILFFDTETTGLYPGQICQLSYIMQTKEGIKSKNFFFSVDYVEPSALAVHGFSVQKLKDLSLGRKFSFFFEEIYKDFEKADLICAHNTNFDFSFMRKEYERLNETFYIKNEFCSMKKSTPICKLPRKNGVGYKYPKLSELCEHVGITDLEISNQVCSLFGTNSSFHDARFDTSALYLAVNKCIQLGYFKDLNEYL